MTSFLEAADRIGARLCRDAIWDGARCNWFSAVFGSGYRMPYRSLAPDLYTGTAGIALFLHCLADATGECIFSRVADGAFQQAIGHYESIPPIERPGFYSGWAGIVYALVRAGRIEQAASIAHRLETELAGSAEFDLMIGSAGAIIGLLHLAKANAGGCGRAIEMAAEHGDVLLRHSHRAEAGWSWRSMARPVRHHLSGFSHGTAGIGWALLELAAGARERRFRDAAEEAFRYERAHFDAERGNWPDFRMEPHEFPVLWCHGAAGIGFSRLRAFELTGDPVVRQEADIAIKTTATSLGNEALRGYSLCHGICGNADLLVYAGAPSVAEASVAQGIEEYEDKRCPWPGGLPDLRETPGLMLGLAGIGYECLRLHDPERYPSVLMPHP
jgi:lantibiotic modifying enzyme